MKDGEVSIAVLVENNSALPDMQAEHGLSFWIETAGSRILFDTGQGCAFAQNADVLGVPLDKADAIVLSHGHYDHTGGLSCAMEQARSARIFIHPESLMPRYSRHADGTMHSVGMPEDVRNVLKEVPERIVWTLKPVEIASGIWVTGPIARDAPFEDVGGDFFLDASADMPDPIVDDQALWIATSGGIIAIVGCAHSGIINTMNAISGLSGAREFRAVIGGLHLRSAGPARLSATADALTQFHSPMLYPAHCTGAGSVRYLSERLPGRVKPCAGGERFVV